MNRVVVTGLGMVTSIGIGKDNFWSNLIKGSSGINPVSLIDATLYKNKRGGEVKNFNANAFIHPKKQKIYGRGSQFAIAASKLALNDAKINYETINSERSAIIIGTTMANIRELEEANKTWVADGEDRIDPSLITKYPGSSLAFNVIYELGLKSLCYCIPTACAAGNYSIGYGFDLIRHGEIDFALVGGADPFSRISFTGFGNLFAMAPEKCQPFDKNRKGMMVGEGAGMLVIESLQHAQARNAPIYAEILGYGLSCDAKHMTLPSVEGLSSVMKKAVQETGIRQEDIDYISAHGTGTRTNDATEAQAINLVFPKEKKEIPVSSIKSMLGHTMGAASAIEAITCVLAIQNSIIPPTINFEEPDEECNIDCVPNKARQQKVKIALNNSFAFGGNNACLVVSQFN